MYQGLETRRSRALALAHVITPTLVVRPAFVWLSASLLVVLVVLVMLVTRVSSEGGCSSLW